MIKNKIDRLQRAKVFNLYESTIDLQNRFFSYLDSSY